VSQYICSLNLSRVAKGVARRDGHYYVHGPRQNMEHNAQIDLRSGLAWGNAPAAHSQPALQYHPQCSHLPYADVQATRKQQARDSQSSTTSDAPLLCVGDGSGSPRDPCLTTVTKAVAPHAIHKIFRGQRNGEQITNPSSRIVIGIMDNCYRRLCCAASTAHVRVPA
jgi:hypothetical protein